MRVLAAFGWPLLAYVLVACSSSSSSGSGAPAAKSGEQAAPGHGSGTCDGACARYLTCKGIDDAANRAKCDSDCASLALAASDLASVEEADCANAVASVEQAGIAVPGGGTGGTGTGGMTIDCANCAWDGSSCVWLSPSTGLSSACDASCCPGH